MVDSSVSITPPLQHIAIIMDGNGRWAIKRNQSRSEGHRHGLTALRGVIRACVKKNIRHLTLFAFSNENWNRPPLEVQSLLNLFIETAEKTEKELVDNGIRVVFIGDSDKFSPLLRKAMRVLEKKTAAGARLWVTIAVSYSGRWDIVQAAAKMASANEDFNENNFSKYLATVNLPPVDLLIRTGGEQRISNFMLWQIAYAELYFSSALWPDFSDEHLSEALEEYARRERRFGGVRQESKNVSYPSC